MTIEKYTLVFASWIVALFMIAHEDVSIFCLRGLQQHHKRKIYDANGNLIDSDNSFDYLSIIHPQKCACVDVMFENSVNFDYVENYGNTQETDERKSFSFDFQAFGEPG